MAKSADATRIESLLHQLGCTTREVEIYIHALSHGAQTVQQIARSLKQNRVTIHSASEQLIDRGLLAETRKGKRRLLQAEDPKVLHRIIEKREHELQLLHANVDFVEQLLRRMQKPKSASRPSVKFYEGIEGLKNMLEETLEAKGEVLVFTHVDIFSGLLDPAYLEKYFQRRSKKGIRTRLIFPPCDFANRVHSKSEAYNINVRLMPKGLHWSAGIFSWNNKIAIKSFTEGNITCTIIENEDIAYFYRKIMFELCWKQATPMEANKA